MARKKIADPTRDLSQYYEQPIGRKAPQASMQLVTSDGGAVPIKKVNPKVQMTPIVQPVAFVPYSTQKEPLYTSTGERAEVETDYDVDDEEAIAERYAYGEPAAPAENAKKKSGVSGAAIALIILSLISAAVLILGKFVGSIAGYIAITTAGGSGYELVEALIANVKNGVVLDLANLIPASIALAGLFVVVTFIASLIRICKRGACVVAKISTFFTLLFALVALIYAIINKTALGYGMYIFTALALIMVLIAYISKNDRKPIRK